MDNKIAAINRLKRTKQIKVTEVVYDRVAERIDPQLSLNLK